MQPTPFAGIGSPQEDVYRNRGAAGGNGEEPSGFREPSPRSAVTAVSTDQLILYGFAHQDPSVEVADATVGSPNNYGIGITEGHKDLAAKVMEYVTNSDWHQDFIASFPDLAAGVPSAPGPARPADEPVAQCMRSRAVPHSRRVQWPQCGGQGFLPPISGVRREGPVRHSRCPRRQHHGSIPERFGEMW